MTTTAQTKRTALKTKVAAGEARQAQRERSLGEVASDAAETATDFVKRHPLTTVAGGLVIGAIIAAMVPGPGRRLGKKAGARGAVLATALADLAATYGSDLLEGATKAAKAGQHRFSDLADSAGDSAKDLGRDAGAWSSDLGNDLGRQATRLLRGLKSRIAD